ncbi:manganese-dependent inorganic pyrophosphatase [Wenyingzhuangia sp. 2_MG-2023]|uniref:manganese-dependent inorganic pyrophosphatase n=1 Tax=Wenyingzhuangia sp. 2_MG-2023 TaxID=3062639 RepID=UPI0026E31C27|nr:manganese-dependent inorganic pyrophosphatase [Wenyingzhuangia sp. 2_MG-2023]MDO6737928.1 manganese-dependent inorganic pyrophosphatase [Wenyingzhuangia sp. 2_MG-2023]MDO6802718.1 manganese-dependent inorganic pyrophosphatase [Wenyingzhuangia sp. 1_MG-2023]
MALKIFGHRSPDTDATASAIVWAWYLSQQGIESTPYVLGTPNTEALYVLKHWGFDVPEVLVSVSAEDEVVIVDTNNPEELFENINETGIVQIIDHHKLVGGLETAGPIDITIKPLASTASVMYLMMGVDEVSDLPNEIAGLMLSCIISDTLEFRSPTTTEDDKAMAQHLAHKLEIDINEYATKMFEAKSDISAFSDEELIKMDSKKYEASGNKYRVSVLETTAPNIVLDRKDSILSKIEDVKIKEGLDAVLLFVVDILKEEATLFVSNDMVKQVAESKFNATVTSDLVVLPGIVSRKKQIIPVL